jgi:hypothetical protein
VNEEYPDIRPREDIRAREDRLHRAEVERRAGKAQFWLDTATDMRDQRDELAADLEAALNAMRSYQAVMVKMNMPNPHFDTIKRLCLKYHMSYEDPRKSAGQIFVDGHDITYDPGDFVGTAEIETVELIADEAGHMAFRALPPGEEVTDAEVVSWEDEDGAIDTEDHERD